MPKQKYSFGELEQAIMDVVWNHDSVTVRDVVEALRERRVAYTTIMTVMNRLVAQRILNRQAGASGAFSYQAKRNREAFQAEASRAAIDDLLQRYGSVAMAQFIDRLDKVPSEKLAELRKKLKKDQRS